jgi:CAAX protease family protein
LEANAIKLKTVTLSMLAILGVEFLASLLNNHWTAPILLVGAVRILEIIIIIWICHRTNPDGIGALGIFPRHLVAGLLKGFLWSAGFGLMVMLAAVILWIAGMQPSQLIRAHLPARPWGLLGFFVVGGIISPVAEEIFFRGVLYGYFRQWGLWVALLLSTAIFVMAHAVFHGFPLPQIVGGVLFALAYEKEKNLMVPITLHVLGNLAIFSVSLWG